MPMSSSTGLPIRVIVVDDSAFIRQMITQHLAADPAIEVVAVAEDPYEARELIKQHNPDVMTLDVEMPKMDGISFLEKVMRLRPMPVIMVSTLTEKGADVTLQALELGALDYLAKPANSGHKDWGKALEELSGKIKAVGRVNVSGRLRPTAQAAPLVYQGGGTRRVIAIGASTGGVEALGFVLGQLPDTLPPILITQHMPPVFTANFARRLNETCKVTVQEAKHLQKLESGNVYIAPGGEHLMLYRQSAALPLCCKVKEGGLVSGHCPSVDVLMRSVATVAGDTAVGVMLTGMGQDGGAGMAELRAAGGLTIGQDAASCVVYGMPRAAKAMGGVMQELSLTQIPQAIIDRCKE